MPYRRLPNTDAARIKAMKAALRKGKEVPPNQLAYSSKLMVEIQRFMPLFDHNLQLYKQTMMLHNKKSRDYYDIMKKARVYLTHFIRVMNMAILRGELSAETRAFYGLSTDDSTTPNLNTESELLSWGRRIIEGEEFRIRKGGSPITNPTIAVVKVRFEKFIEAWTYHNTLAKRTLDYLEKNVVLRKEADEIILKLWNEIESTCNTLPDPVKMNKCEDYGVVYFYRKNELNKEEQVSSRTGT